MKVREGSVKLNVKLFVTDLVSIENPAAREGPGRYREAWREGNRPCQKDAGVNLVDQALPLSIQKYGEDYQSPESPKIRKGDIRKREQVLPSIFYFLKMRVV